MANPTTIAQAIRGSAAPAGLTLAAALALYAQAMAPRLLAQAAYGPICSGHGSVWAPHCPICYAAVALAFAAAALLAGPPLLRARRP
jgi:hypothetical protein